MVRPYEPYGPLYPGDGMFIVRARLRLADGTQVRGYLTSPVQGDSSLGTLQPAVVVGGGQVSFWCGMLAPEPAQVAASYARLGKSSASEVFPVRFESDPRFKGVWYTATNFALILLSDTSEGQYPRPHRRFDDRPGHHTPGGC